MRQNLVRGIAALAAVAALGSVAACGNAANKKACTDIQKDFKSFSPQVDVNDPGKASSDLASKIRTDAKDATGDVKTSANDLADDFDKIGSSASSGQQPDTSAINKHAQNFGKACGISMTLPGV